MADELDKMVSEFTPKNRYELLHKALMYALQRDKVEALNTLLEYSVDVDRFDVGKSYCFVKYHEHLTMKDKDALISASAKEMEKTVSRKTEADGSQFTLKPRISEGDLRAQLNCFGWEADEFRQLWDVLTNDQTHLVQDDPRLLDRQGLLSFNPCGLLKGFKEMDATKDERLDRAELERGLKSIDLSKKHILMLFDSIDTDDDGRISMDEYIHFQMNYWLFTARLKKASNEIKYVNASECWSELIEYSREHCDHFNYFWDVFRQELKTNCSTYDEDPSAWKAIAGKVRKSIESHQKKIDSHELMPGSPIHPKLRAQLFQQQHAFKHKQAESHEIVIHHCQAYKKLNTLEYLYMALLGDDFRYRIGIQGPYTDLFFWNVLHNRKDLAKVMWDRVWFPVRTALGATCLLRKMADAYERVDPMTANSMRENADFFEEQAVLVQKEAAREDQNVALDSLDCEVPLWRGQAVVDLAVISESFSFLEECCKEAVENRLYGDLNASSLNTWKGTVKILAGILSLGLLPALIPGYLDWNPPPKGEALRRKTQRRSIPIGYPNKPSNNPILVDRWQRNEAQAKAQDLRLERNARPSGNNTAVSKKKKMGKHLAKWKKQHEKEQHTEGLAEGKLQEIWSPTFGALERWRLFWVAPITLFYANIAVTLSMTVVFTSWFVSVRVKREASEQEMPPLTLFEYTLVIWMQIRAYMYTLTSLNTRVSCMCMCVYLFPQTNIICRHEVCSMWIVLMLCYMRELLPARFLA